MKKTIFILAILVFGYVIFTGQKVDDRKWGVDPRMTQIKPTGTVSDYIPLVMKEPIRTFTTPQVYNTPVGLMQVNPNVRVHPSITTQSEVPITRHPTNQQILFASSNAARMSGSSLQMISEGMYLSTNGGLTWFGSDTTAAAPLLNHGGDPAPAIGLNGYLYQSYLGYTTSGMFATYSSNMGATWANTSTIVSGSQDKNHTFVNDVAASPYAGRVYVTWSLFTASSPNCVVSYSSNNGTSWSGVISVNTPPASHYAQGVNGAVMPNGDAVICWQSPTSGTPYTGDYIGFSKSTNGGVTWTTNNNIYDCNGIRGNLSAKGGIRVNDFPWMGIDRTGGARDGWIYIATAEKSLAPAGSDPDIILHKSTDGGTTWSAGVRVNQDALNNGKTQYMPALRVDEFGGVNVVYYDDRNLAANAAEVWVSRSIDGGVTFTDILVSDHSFIPASISGLAGGYQGDYIGITSGNNKVYPYWADNSTGLYQAWITTIDLGPAINHTPLSNTEQISGNRVVNASIIPAGSGLNPGLTKLYYAKNNTAFASVPLTNTSGTNWTANLPLTGAGTYNYYLTTTDSLIRTATSPAGAPANYYSFTASSDTVRPIIVTTPLANVPKSTWPPTVTATATDNIGIDSVWVKWYKNTTSTGIKQFRLLNTSGSIYAAAFNSDTSQIAVNDSIFYRVFARDISSAHNSDSTALYKFKIINQVTTTIGTGTISSNYPFTTYWKDGRTQYLYLASELNLPSGYVAQIGFDVINADPGAMNAFKVSMQNTSLSTMTGFVTTGWNTAFAPSSYTVPGTGWQMITLASPFYYSSGSNLLVEVCYNNSAYTNYSNVNSTPATGMFYGKYND
ncbi:MAG: sialidase family protein, partial [Ignavibacteriae bacterium]|nr:sialidase family protein [Ignavibacteriota bacterium]